MQLDARTTLALVAAFLIPVLVGCGPSAAVDDGATPSATADESAVVDPAPQTPTALPTPDDVSGMQDWFAGSYPDAAWLGRIEKVEYVKGEVPDSGGFANAIVITTDLDFGSEQAIAEEIAAAVGEAHPGWAKQMVLRYADGNNITAGDIFDRTP